MLLYLQELQKAVPTVDENLEILGTNLASTKDVVSQFPKDLEVPGDVDHCSKKVNALQERWEDLKKKLKILSIETAKRLADLENGEKYLKLIFFTYLKHSF